MAFSSGASGSTSAPAAGGFSFGSSSGSTPAAVFSFGTTAENSTASGPTAGSGSGFSFGAAPSGGDSGGFGAVGVTKSGGVGGKRGADGEKPTSFGATSTSTGGFGGFSGAAPTAGGFGFSGSAPAPTAAAAAFSFGSASSALADSPPRAGDSAAPVQASGGFNFGAAAPADTAPAPAAGGFSFGAAAPADTAPAPAAGGFSFGAAAPANAAPALAGGGFSFGAVVSKPSEAVPAPAAPAAGGFSFGAVDAAPAPGGFSFGAAPLADAAAKSLASKAPENNAAALSFVDTPDSKAADPKPATPAAPSLVGVSTTAAPARAKDPARLEYQTLTVEQILNKFQKELESDAVDYMKQAHRVMQYDAILRDSQRSLSHMTQQTSKLLVQQTELEQLLQGIGAFQTELDSNLTKMETQVDDLFRAQSHVTPVEADRKREQAYNTAVEVDGRLSILTTNLQSSLHALEGAQENIMTAEVGDVVRIMNMHQSQLEQLERATRTMDHDIKQLEQMMAATTST